MSFPSISQRERLSCVHEANISPMPSSKIPVWANLFASGMTYTSINAIWPPYQDASGQTPLPRDEFVFCSRNNFEDHLILLSQPCIIAATSAAFISCSRTADALSSSGSSKSWTRLRSPLGTDSFLLEQSDFRENDSIIFPDKSTARRIPRRRSNFCTSVMLGKENLRCCRLRVEIGREP